MNYQYIQIRSFHIVATPTRQINGYRTLCGRNANGSPVDVLLAARSCETCLRLATRAADPEDDASSPPEGDE